MDGWPSASHRLETTTGGEPLEDGAQITDHAVARQARVTLEGWVSDWSGGDRPAAAWDAIRTLQKSAEPVDVMTEWATYPEMLIRRAEAQHTARGMRMRIEFEEVIRVGVESSELPPGELSGPAEGRSGEVSRGRVPLTT